MGLLSGILGHGRGVDVGEVTKELEGVLLPSETVEVGFRTVRDLIVFTTSIL